MYEDIKKIILAKKPDIDNQTLTYFTNYFYIIAKDNIVPDKIRLIDLIENAIQFASKVVFYDETHPIYQKYGKEIKGFRDPETKTILIRNNLEEPLREITVYHELHHAVQTNPLNTQVGINQEGNIGRLIMEAQTQYIAEKLYSEIHGITFEEKEIPSEKLRMIGNGVIVSSLHNYEMYDSLLSKLAIILDVPKDYFVSINYLYENNEGLKDLEEKYNIARERHNLPYNFEGLLLIFDYIYCVDLMAYIDSPVKNTILPGKETTDGYEIHPGESHKLSLLHQRNYMNKFDVDYFLALMDTDGNYREFAKYVIDLGKRKIINLYTSSFEQTSQQNLKNKK